MISRSAAEPSAAKLPDPKLASKAHEVVDGAGPVPADARTSRTGWSNALGASVLGPIVRRRVIFILLFLFGSVAVGLSVLAGDPVYEADALVRVESPAQPRRSGETGTVIWDRTSMSEVGDGQRVFLLEVEGPLANRVADQLVSSGFTTISDSTSEATETAGYQASRDEIAARLRTTVRFESEGLGSTRVKIVASSEDPQEAAAIANAYARAYIELSEAESRSELSAARRFLDQEEERWKTELREAEEAVDAYGGVKTLNRGEQSLLEEISDLAVQLDAVTMDLGIQLSTKASTERERDSLRQSIADPDPTTARGRATARRIEDLETIAAEQDLLVRQLEVRAEAVERMLDDKQSQQRVVESGTRPFFAIELRRMQASKMYEYVVTWLWQVLAAEQDTPGYVTLIRAARAPDVPVSPNARGRWALAMIFGFFFALGGSVVADRVVRRRHQVRLEDAVGIGLLGVLPRWSHLAGREIFNSVTDGDGFSPEAAIANAIQDLPGAVLEACRGITEKVVADGAKFTIRHLLVTSASMGDGKSTASVCLAVELAHSGRKTLLVDADLRRPQLHRMLKISRSPGLGDLDDEHLSQAPRPAPTGIDNLYVMPAGNTVRNPSEFLDSSKLTDLLHSLGATFDVVIIDSPAVRAATDAASLAARTDGCVMVARPGFTTPRDLRMAVEILESVGATIVGLVLNDVDGTALKARRQAYMQRKRGARHASSAHCQTISAPQPLCSRLRVRNILRRQTCSVLA